MITVSFKNTHSSASFTFEGRELECLIHAGGSFGVEMTESQVVDFLQRNKNLTVEAYQWGVNDTVVRDNIFLALVKEWTGKSWEQVKREFPEDPYLEVKKCAGLKGFTIEP